MREELKVTLQNYGLLLSTIVILYMVLEVFMFFCLPYLPLRLQGYLPRAIGLLSQSSKSGLKPRNYIALFGDSYAQGQGEWLLSVSKWKNPDFGSQHILHRRTGRDVLSFGAGGVGSLGGIVAKPLNGLRYLDSTMFFKIERPKTILVYFFENDVNNNFREFERRFKGSYDIERLYDAAYFRGFIEEMAIGQDRHYSEDLRSFSWHDNLVFSQFIKNIIAGVLPEMKDDEKKQKKIKVKRPEHDTVNLVRVDGKDIPIPGRLQSPALELTESEIKLSAYFFEQALEYMSRSFSDAQILVVYIPSPLASYELASQNVSIETYHDRDEIYDAADVARKNGFVSNTIKSITERKGFVFINATEAIRMASQKELLHGPSEWKHFNKRGYTVLAEAILPHIK